MDNIVLKQDSDTVIEFDLNLAGTSNDPTSVVGKLSQGGTSIEFIANKTETSWAVTVKNPSRFFDTLTGLVFSIQVIVADKVFTPFKSPVSFEETVEVKASPIEHQAPAEQPAQLVKVVPAPVEPVISVDATVHEPKAMSMLKSFDIKENYTPPAPAALPAKTELPFRLTRLKIVEQVSN